MVDLVFKYVCCFQQLDATGQQQGSVFRESVKRNEHDAVDVIGQVEEETLDTLSMWSGGRDLEEKVYIYCHRRDLTRRGYIDSDTGLPTVPRIGDRLVEIRNTRQKTIVKVRNPPGAYVDAVVPCSFGPCGSNALFQVRLNARRSSR